MNYISIKSERLTIAPPFYLPRDEDLDDLLAIYSDPKFIAHMSGPLSPGSQIDKHYIIELVNEVNEDWREGRPDHYYLMRDNKTGTVVGIVKLHECPCANPGDVEIIYAVHPKFRQRGYALEGAGAVINHEFNTGLSHIMARTTESNPASKRILTALGFARIEQFDQVKYVPEPELAYILRRT